VLPAGKFGQEKDGGTRADFSMLAASGVSTVRSRTSGLGLSQKPDTSGRDSYLSSSTWSLIMAPSASKKNRSHFDIYCAIVSQFKALTPERNFVDA